MLALAAPFDAAAVDSFSLARTYSRRPPVARDQFGYSVAAAGTRLLVGAPFDDEGAQDGGAVHLIDARRGSFLLSLTAPRPAAGDQFGTSVAAVGPNILVGAPLDDTDGADAGAAYLFDGDPDSPDFGRLLATLRNPTPAAGDRFGFAVAGVGAYPLVGAPGDDEGADDAGAAYLFDADPGSATFGQPLRTFRRPTVSGADQFGSSLAGVGRNVLVGAPFSSTAQPNAGAADLFDGDPNSPTFGGVLKSFQKSPPAAGDLFAASVAAAGMKVLIGAPFDDTRAVDAGAVFLFDGDPASAQFGMLLGTFQKSTPAAGDLFGFSVAALGERLLVGAAG